MLRGLSGLGPYVVERLPSIKLVVLDLDGTLLSESGDYGALAGPVRMLASRGIHFTIATGRTLAGAEAGIAVLDHLGVSPNLAAVYNGCVLMSGESREPFSVLYLEKEIHNELLEYCSTRGLQSVTYTASPGEDGRTIETAFADDWHTVVDDIDWMQTHRALPIDDLAGTMLAVFIKEPAQIQDSAAVLAGLQNTFAGRLSVTSSGCGWIEACHPRGTKANAIHAMAVHYRLPIDRVMAIGDGANDVGMIAHAGVGVAVRNAVTAARNVADVACYYRGTEGVAEALSLLLHAL